MASVASAQEKFDAAVQVIHSLPKNGSFQPSHAMMLTFYGLYKQATFGQCNISKPAFWDVVGKAKWDAWNRLGTMRREQAMLNYVDELKKIIETMPHTENVQGFVEKLGDFYELVDDETSKGPLPTLIKNASPKKKFAPASTASDGGSIIISDREEITRHNGKTSLNGSGRRGGSESSDHSPSSENNSSTNSHVLDGDEDLSESVIVSAHDDHGYYTNGSSQTDAGLYSNISNEVIRTGPSDAPAVTGTKVRDNDDSEHDSTPNSSSSDDTDHHDDDDDDEFCDTSDISHIPPGEGSMAALFGSAAPSELGQSWVLEPTTELSVDVASTSFNSHSSDHNDGTPGVTTAMDRSLVSDLSQSPSVTDLVVGRGGGDRPGEPGSGGTRRASGTSATGRGIARSGGSIGSGASERGVGQTGSRSDQRLLGASGGSGGDIPGHRPLHRHSVVEQVSVALVRLQQDMDSVITRLQSLESLSLAQHQIVVARSRHNSGQSHGHSSAARWWRPFQRMNASTIAFLVLWPFFAQFIIRFISKRGRRLRR